MHSKCVWKLYKQYKLRVSGLGVGVGTVHVRIIYQTTITITPERKTLLDVHLLFVHFCFSCGSHSIVFIYAYLRNDFHNEGVIKMKASEPPCVLKQHIHGSSRKNRVKIASKQSHTSC